MLARYRQVELLMMVKGPIDSLSDYLDKKTKIFDDPLHIDDSESLECALDELDDEWEYEVEKMEKEFEKLTKEEFAFIESLRPRRGFGI